MKTANSWRGWVLLGAGLLLGCVLSFYRPTAVAAPNGAEPFANAVEQRAEMVEQLKEINAQLKEQNGLLRGAIKALAGGEASK